jgi:hypothetical protein
VDGGGGFAVELLIDDGFDESFKRGLRAADAHGELAGAFDEFAEFGVCGGEFAAGESVVVARRTWAVEGTRHVLTVPQMQGVGNREQGVGKQRRKDKSEKQRQKRTADLSATPHDETARLRSR